MLENRKSGHEHARSIHPTGLRSVFAVVGSERLLESAAEIPQSILPQTVNHASVLTGSFQQINPLEHLQVLRHRSLRQRHSLDQFSTTQTVGMLHELGNNGDSGRMAQSFGKLRQGNGVCGEEIGFIKGHDRIIAILNMPVKRLSSNFLSKCLPNRKPGILDLPITQSHGSPCDIARTHSSVIQKNRHPNGFNPTDHSPMKFLLSVISMVSISLLQGLASDTPEQLLGKMTLEEKIGQLNLYASEWDLTGPPPTEGSNADKYEHIRAGKVGGVLNVTGADAARRMQQLAVEGSRLGIPLLFGYDVIHGYRTSFPIPLGESSSWNLELMEQTARISAIEATAAGLNWVYSPMIDTFRDPRWGRVMEGSGEDPFLTSKIAAAKVRGYQGTDLSRPDTLAACAKHFAGYGFPVAGRDYNTTILDGRTLHNIILPPFKAAVDAGVRSVMNSFNLIDGIPATAHAGLQRDILKGKWKFDGFVVSDWASIAEIAVHGAAADLRQAAQRAILAGSDMDMESFAYVTHLAGLVEEGLVSEAWIDDAVLRILRVKTELGLFDDPYRYIDAAREREALLRPEHLDLALDAAIQSIVLLKNDTNLLPLDKDAGKIALIGALADDKDSPLGNWRGMAIENSAVSVVEGFRNLGVDFTWTKGVTLAINPGKMGDLVNLNTTDRSGFEEAIRLARESEVVVMVLGELGHQTGEGRSRADIGLPGLQQELLEAVHAVNPNIVLVLMNGRPLTLPWAAENVPAILTAWHGGSRAGDAIARVLFGLENPSGKLTMSWPRSLGQIPVYYNRDRTGRPNANPSVFWSHYNDESNEPLYPFGHGLSYTSFGYSELQVTPSGPRTIDVSVRVSNLGQRSGTEVVQLYLTDPVAQVVRPVKELKGFARVTLAPGESTVQRFSLTESELGYFLPDGSFTFEPGEFILTVGPTGTLSQQVSVSTPEQNR